MSEMTETQDLPACRCCGAPASIRWADPFLDPRGLHAPRFFCGSCALYVVGDQPAISFWMATAS